MVENNQLESFTGEKSEENMQSFRRSDKKRSLKLFEHRDLFRKLSKIFFVFAVIYFIAMIILDFNSGSSIKVDLPRTGGIAGPVEVKKENEVYLIKVAQPVGTNQSTYVGGDVLDKDKKYLFGFGKDLWDEDGQDIDGYWHESETSYDMRVTFPHKGIYYLQFETEMSNPDQTGDVSVEIVPKLGSSLAYLWMAVISVAAAVMCFMLSIESYED